MNRNSRITVYAGVNFVFAPQVTLTLDNRQAFQRQLEELGIELPDYRYEGQKLIASRSTNIPLQITIGQLAPQIGQLLIVAPDLANRSLEGMGHEASDIANVFAQLWPNRQIVSCDATIRDLYDTTREHAFQEIWESRLRQPPESLAPLNRPVMGGGLRFVMPPIPNNPSDPMIELKIESFLQNSRKLFFEAQVTWNQPQPPGSHMDPESRLNFVDNFIQQEVVRFMMEE